MGLKQLIQLHWGFPGGITGKVSTCQCRRSKRQQGFNLWVKKIPWSRKWCPTPVFLPGKFHGQRSLVGYSPWGHKELGTIEHSTALLHWSCYLSQLIYSCFFKSTSVSKIGFLFGLVWELIIFSVSLRKDILSSRQWKTNTCSSSNVVSPLGHVFNEVLLLPFFTASLQPPGSPCCCRVLSVWSWTLMSDTLVHSAKVSNHRWNARRGEQCRL